MYRNSKIKGANPEKDKFKVCRCLIVNFETEIIEKIAKSLLKITTEWTLFTEKQNQHQILMSYIDARKKWTNVIEGYWKNVLN